MLGRRPAGPNYSEDFIFVLFFSWPGLACAPIMAFAAGFFMRGRKPAAQNNSEDFIFIMLFRGRAGFVSYGLCGWVLHAWAQTSGPE